MIIKRINLSALFIIFFGSAIASVNVERDAFASLFAKDAEFLKVDDAFKLTTEVLDEDIIVKFEIADGYYLYRSRFNFEAEGASLQKAVIPKGKNKVDEYLGDVEVYYRLLELSVPFVAHQEQFIFTLEYQGCAEAGLCYPPEERQITLYAEKTVAKTTSLKVNEYGDSKWTKSFSRAPQSLDDSVEEGLAAVQAFVPEQEKVVNLLTDKSFLEIVGYFVLIGIGLAFTPCVLPMVPILSSIIVGQGKTISSAKALALSLTYTQSMAIPYAVMGLLVGAAGGALGNALQQPLFIIPAAIIFILLSLSMFGFYDLQLPRFVQNKLNCLFNSQRSGSYLGAGVMGFISALVVSPCVTVPLAGILLYISQTGDSIIGGVALYSLAIGMGIPLLVFGIGGNKFLPKSGRWMNAVKAAFGVVMLGMALFISKHLVPAPLYLFAWAALLIVSAVYMGALSSCEGNVQKFWKGVGIVLLVYGITLILGAVSGGSRLLSPLAKFGQNVGQGTKQNTQMTGHLTFEMVKTITEVEQEIREANAEGKTVMFDFFAESCTACYEFAERTFPDPNVQQALKNTRLIQADVTTNDHKDQALMAHFDVRGLPSILFFDTRGQEVKRLRAVGYENAEVFVKRINAAFGEKK